MRSNGGSFWTDVLKMLPRRNLVKNIAPACYRFKEICDKNVKNVHVIEKATQFADKLEEDDLEANEQMEHLAANGCQLASQFKLSKVRIGEKSQTILRHCPDLFKRCQITLIFEEENKDSTLFLKCLAELETANPIEIYVSQEEDQVVDFWHHPTFLYCNRAHLFFGSDQSTAAMMNIFDWLHHQPDGVDCDGSADQQVRCMILDWLIGTGQDHLDWLINRCSKDIQQTQQPVDRRPFVLSFDGWDWTGFGQFRRIENKSTREVLVLERKMLANGEATHRYRLRRCLTEEEANGAEFYAVMFLRDRAFDAFNIGAEKPEVLIK